MTYTTGYQVAQGPPAQPKKPSPALLILGALVLLVSVVVGLLLLTVFGTVSRSDRIENFGRFLVEDGGTEADIDIKSSGDYTIYYEYAGEIDGQELDADENPPDDLNITVVDDDDDPLRVRSARDPLVFTSGDRAGVEVGTVDFPASGAYVLTATGGDETYGISIGRGSLDEDESNDANKLAGILVLIVGGLVGVVLILLGLAQRGRGRGTPQPTYGGPQYPQPPYAGPPPQGGYGAPGQGWGTPPTPPQGGWPAPGGSAPGGSPPGGWGAPPPPSQPGTPNPPFPGP